MLDHLRFTYSLRPLFAASIALALPACTYPKELGDSPIAGESDTSSGSTSAQPTDGPAATCDNPAFTCTQPVDCEQWNCGAPASPFDASGCMRQKCDDSSPCAADEICFSVSQDCHNVVLGCADEGDACACEISEDCISTSHCIPADEGPPVECPLITDAEACAAADCSEFYGEVSLVGLDEHGECVVQETRNVCLFFPGDAWGGAATPGSFYEKATGLATSFATDWAEPPIGWGACGDPDSPPACSCYSICKQLNQQAEDFLAQDLPCNDVSDCVLAEAICYDSDQCGTVGVHKDNADEWASLHADLEANGCCDGAALCGPGLACENNRCVAGLF